MNRQTGVATLPSPHHSHHHAHHLDHHSQSAVSPVDGSQATTMTTDSDRVFTPPASDSEGSTTHDTVNGPSSQDSQLMQLSQLAAEQQRMAETDSDAANAGLSRKRMADGFVKHSRNTSTASAPRMGHSRNTSTVSMASTTGSRIGELSAELKTKLSYAMVKVNNGWQSHSIDEVESLASRAASPASSTSTLYGRHGPSASPRAAMTAARHGISHSITTPPIHMIPPPSRTYESFWRENGSRPRSSTSPHVPALGPPASIQPRQPGPAHPRRNSTARHTPAYLASSHQASPHTPAQPSPLQGTPAQTSRTPQVDPILFSPHQNAREQEALETLMFMSSPGNSANMKNNRAAANAARTALPTSRLGIGAEASTPPRKSLPTGRPGVHASGAGKRVGFERSPSEASQMQLDEPYGSPQAHGTPRRRMTAPGQRPSLSIPAGLGPARSRPTIQDEDIERMLDKAGADDSSDSEGEINLPQARRQIGV